MHQSIRIQTHVWLLSKLSLIFFYDQPICYLLCVADSGINHLKNLNFSHIKAVSIHFTSFNQPHFDKLQLNEMN